MKNKLLMWITNIILKMWIKNVVKQINQRQGGRMKVTFTVKGVDVSLTINDITKHLEVGVPPQIIVTEMGVAGFTIDESTQVYELDQAEMCKVVDTVVDLTKDLRTRVFPFMTYITEKICKLGDNLWELKTGHKPTTEMEEPIQSE